MATIREAKPGDVVICQGVRAVIAEIFSQYTDTDYDVATGEITKVYYGIEFVDTKGRYRNWKQRYDGGQIIFK